jgi:hypothetical protein
MKVWVRLDWIPIVEVAAAHLRSLGADLRTPGACPSEGCQAQGRAEDFSNGRGTCWAQVRHLRRSWEVSRMRTESSQAPARTRQRRLLMAGRGRD